MSNEKDTADMMSGTAFDWEEIYAQVRRIVAYQVQTAHLAAWRGQEADLVEDIVQEAVYRLLERDRRAERDEVEPTREPLQMLIRIARNYCRDLLRREWRLVRVAPEGSSYDAAFGEERESFADLAVENVYREDLCTRVAHEVVSFPKKQRRALLGDLAEAIPFEAQPTPIEVAFRREGIELQEYRPPLEEGAQEHGRRISLRNHAYRRLLQLPALQEYIAESAHMS